MLDNIMKRFVHPIDPSNKVNVLNDRARELKTKEFDGRKFLLALRSIQEEDEVTNTYNVVRTGSDFKITFSDGRQLKWNTNNLPSNWIDIMWEYATNPQKNRYLSVGNVPGSPGSIFDSKACTDID